MAYILQSGNKVIASQVAPRTSAGTLAQKIYAEVVTKRGQTWNPDLSGILANEITTIDQVNALMDGIRIVNPSYGNYICEAGDLIKPLRIIEDALTAFDSATNTNSLCDGSCVGLCEGCTSGCTSKCGGDCTGTCNITCTNKCGGSSCTGSCKTTCNGCKEQCQDDCYITCTGKCVNTCSGTSSGIGGCFAPGTLILMSDLNLKRIEEIKVGDIVLSYNENDKQFIPKTVLKSYVFHHTPAIAQVDFSNGENLVMTLGHPLLSDEGWKSLDIDNSLYEHSVIASLLNVGDKILSYNNNQIDVVNIIYCDINNNYDSYNIEVEDCHTFIANGFVVHNTHNSAKA